MLLNHTKDSTAPTPPMTINTYSQLTSWVIQASSGLKITSAAYWEILNIAEAVPRSRSGNHADTIRLLAGITGASAKPTIKRRINSINAAEAKKCTKPDRKSVVRE